MSNKLVNILIKGLIILKSVLLILFLISSIAIVSELYLTRNQFEGRELIESTQGELISVLAILVGLIATLLFDIRTLKIRSKTIFNEWLRLILFTLLVIVVSTFFKSQWIGITLFLLITIYSIYLLKKFPKK